MGQNLCLHFGADEHPCTTYFDVHQEYRVLTHSQVGRSYLLPVGPRFRPAPNRLQQAAPVQDLRELRTQAVLEQRGQEGVVHQHPALHLAASPFFLRVSSPCLVGFTRKPKGKPPFLWEGGPLQRDTPRLPLQIFTCR